MPLLPIGDLRNDETQRGNDPQSDQPAESTAEHKAWPDPQRAADGEEKHAKPASGIPVEGPKPVPVCVGRQIGGQQPDQCEGYWFLLWKRTIVAGRGRTGASW